MPVWQKCQLYPCDEGFIGESALSEAPHVVFYAFELVLHDGAYLYYVPCVDGRSTAGQLVVPGVDGEWTLHGWVYNERLMEQRPTGDLALADPLPGFQATVYGPTFVTPSWLSGALMYQIFPDRFSREPKGVRQQGVQHHKRLNRPLHLHENWNEPVEWLGQVDAQTKGSLAARMKAYDPIDFYGGTLEGIRNKLPYLASLGVEVLYLNPIFEARSNHRYDTADYEHVDALLGTDQDFENLARDARKLGIHIVLDAVLSHTGNDSRYFNAQGTYAKPGAMQGTLSPYYSWFDFEHMSEKAPYRCWWGDPTLPEVNENDPTWQRYMLDEDQGILSRWLRKGASGYRLDVADEVPDDVLVRIRSSVKATNPEAAIIGEVWEDATTKESYGSPRIYALGTSLDSVMNYPLRNALLGFALGTIDAFQLVAFLKQQQVNYPAPMHACLMNLLSSHDVERMRSVLALGKTIKQNTRARQIELTQSITPERDAHAAELQRFIVALMYALPGAPCIYYGDEWGLHGGGDPFCRATLPDSEQSARQRDDCGEPLVGFYRELGLLRKESIALRNGICSYAAAGADVACVIRSDNAGNTIIAIANRSGLDRSVSLDTASPSLAMPQSQRQAIRNATAARQVFATSTADNNGALRFEDGIMLFTTPACSTVLWRIES